MTPERFHQIVEAYGAEPHRWPLQERAAAQAWAQSHRAQADAVLSDAAGLDAWLGADRIEPPGVTLQQRIVERAPRRRIADRAGRRRLWWSGAAVAGVGLLGGVAGAFAVSFFVLTENALPLHDGSYEPSYLTSSFGGNSADWSGE